MSSETRDAPGVIREGEDFAGVFPTRVQPALAPRSRCFASCTPETRPPKGILASMLPP